MFRASAWHIENTQSYYNIIIGKEAAKQIINLKAKNEKYLICGAKGSPGTSPPVDLPSKYVL